LSLLPFVLPYLRVFFATGIRMPYMEITSVRLWHTIDDETVRFSWNYTEKLLTETFRLGVSFMKSGLVSVSADTASLCPAPQCLVLRFRV
jgi:hypothetical protein